MINFNISEKNIVGKIGKDAFAVPYTKELWEQLTSANLELAKAGTKKEYDAAMETALKAVSGVGVDDSIEKITPNVIFNKKTNTYHLATTDGEVASDIPLPKILIEKMKYADSNGLPVTPIIKFATRLLRNPRARTTEGGKTLFERTCNYVFRTYIDPVLYKQFNEEQGFESGLATKMATIYQTPITQEGLICTKKVVEVDYDAQRFKFVKDEDGFAKAKKILKDGIDSTVDEETGKVTITDPEFAEDWRFYPVCMGRTGGDAWSRSDLPEGTKTHYYKIGTIAELEPNQVNWNDNQSCSKGLHTGNYDYVKSWVNSSNVVLDVFVDPEHIAAIPSSDADGVLRVVQLFIYDQTSLQVPLKSVYHSSTYAAKTDAAWAETLKELIQKNLNEEQEILEKLKAKREALQNVDRIK
jgi:hypothetical protein